MSTISTEPVASAFVSPPGVTVCHSPAISGQYIGSPSLARLPDGAYVATHDFFGPKSTWDQTDVYRSDDRGEMWRKISTIHGQWWSTIFVHGKSLYLIGTSKEHGLCVIRRSDDGGFTWTEPRDEKTGILRTGEFHTAPVPVVIHRGRIWRAIEDAGRGTNWPERYSAMVISAPEDADLLDANSWISTPPLYSSKSWLGGTCNGWLEGNFVVGPNDVLLNILRTDQSDTNEYASCVHVSEDGTTLSFDPEKDFIRLPGGGKKFTIRFDPATSRYWSLVNNVAAEHREKWPPFIRNTLSLASSPDLKNWRLESAILHHPDIDFHGFQYVDWLFEGDDIIALSRTAWSSAGDKANNYHDANYMTFHRIRNFRNIKS